MTWLWAIVSLALVAGVAGAVWFAYRRGSDQERAKQAEKATAAIAEATRQEERDQARAQVRSEVTRLRLVEIDKAENADERREPKTPAELDKQAQDLIQRAIKEELDGDPNSR